MTTNPRSVDYKSWSREQLIERLLALEDPRPVNEPSSSTESKHGNRNEVPIRQKEFNFSNYSRRKVALKFCYSGWEYCGLAYQGDSTQLPTVEGVLFEALAKARLIDREGGLEGCGWEKCGRTDRGVSAAGQVISLWVRSAIGGGREGKKMMKEEVQVVEKEKDVVVGEDLGLPGLGEEDFGTLGISETIKKKKISSDSSLLTQKRELDYIAILNRLLPPTIRILAWAPVAESFSARFSCKYRHYKYFFSSHDLDISAMRQAAMRLVGEHDFRNLCKVDAQKQITMFRRVISRADIEPVDGERMFVFNLVGSAFLYHQVRHIMAILFLVGSGLEEPALVTKLMNISIGAEYDVQEVVDRKPEYQMADALPLMLWDCGYGEEDVKWRSGTLEPSSDEADGSANKGSRRSGQGTETDLYHQLHSIWNRSRIYTVLDRHFLQAAEVYHKPPVSLLPLAPGAHLDMNTPVNYPLGGGTYKRVQKYVPVLARNRLDTVEVINERWRVGKGARKEERRNAAGVGGEEGEDDGDE